MQMIAGILREAFGLVVDDGSLAAAVVLWVAAVWLGTARLGLDARWAAIVLFAGLALVLTENAVRRARR